MPVEIERPQRAKGMVHKQIADTAKGLAAEFYEQMASDQRSGNAFVAKYPAMRPFVGHNWRLFVGIARQTLVSMLASKALTEPMKAKIYEAITMDGAVNPRRMAKPAPTPPPKSGVIEVR